MSKLPYIFLMLLVILFTFLFGINYGRRVEQANKVIAFIMTGTPTPQPTRASTYEVYRDKTCGFQFVYDTIVPLTNRFSAKCQGNPVANETPTASGEAIIVSHRNPKTQKTIWFSVHKDLYPLFEKTLQFLP